MTAPFRKRAAFTLAELLTAAVIIACASGMALQASGGSEASERRNVKNEALDFSLWLKRRMSLAAREGVAFSLKTVKDAKSGKRKVMLTWKGGVKRLEQEIYRFEESVLYYEGATELIFSGNWYTLTPAATFIVKSKTRPSVKCYVKAAGTGYVSVSED